MDARAERTRLAMIEAVTHIIVEEGASAVTHQRVAERAGVGRATVYRHWPTSEDMLLSVFELVRFPEFFSEEGTAEARLTMLLRWLATQFARTTMRAFILTMAERAVRDPAVARVMQERMAEFRRGIMTILDDTAIDFEEPDDALMARLVGPIWFRVLVQRQEADDSFIRGIVSDFLARYRTEISQ
jgi:AcrR family transcriptional regulator